MRSSVSFPGWRPGAGQDAEGINFALALSRLSGLPMEFTYLYDHSMPPPSNEEINPAMLCGVSVIDADTNSYRPDGIYPGTAMVPDFDLVAQAKLSASPSLQRLAMSGRLSLGTRIIAESRARSLGLLAGEDDARLTKWLEVIPSNTAYYSRVPVDLSLPPVHPYIMRYAHNECHFYALALARATEGTPMAFPNEGHSLVKHGDFLLEDVWGYRDPAKVSIQYGARSPDELSAEKFQEIMSIFRWKMGADYQSQVDAACRVVSLRLAARAALQQGPANGPSGP